MSVNPALTTLRYNATSPPASPFTWGSVTFTLDPDITTPTEKYYTGTTTSIPNSTVPGFATLTEVTIGNSVTSIGENAFGGCTSLTSVTIPNSVTSIGLAAFQSCSLLASVIIPSSVTSIGDSAFNGCPLTSIIIPNSVLTIGAFSFEACDRLASVIIGSSVTSIGLQAFDGCTELRSITIPTSVTSINATAFTSSALATVTIANGQLGKASPATGVSFFGATVTTILPPPTILKYSGTRGTNFTWDTGVGSVPFTFDSEISTPTVFSYISSSTTTSIPNSTVPGQPTLIEVIIGDSVTSIGQDSFINCTTLASVTIGSAVSTITTLAFSGCSLLTSFTVALGNTNYSSLAGVLFNINKTTLVVYPGGKSGSYTIPSTVTSIGDSAFYVCALLTSVTIGSLVTTIGDYAFDQTTFSSITIPSSVTTIGANAFASSSLATVTIANGQLGKASPVSNPPGVSFFGATVTTILPPPITLKYNATSPPASPFTWGSVTFTRDEGLPGFSYTSSSTTAVPASQVPGFATLTEVIIGNSVTSIGENAFGGCTLLTSVTIPNSVTSIGIQAFQFCTLLTSITIPNSVLTIGGGAFQSCTLLTSITIGNSVTSIGEYAFGDCSDLTSITVDTNNAYYSSPGGVLFNKLQTTLIAYPADKSGSSYAIPNSVTSIDNYAFYVCTSLTSVTIPNSVTSIGDYAFGACSSLTIFTVDTNNAYYSSPGGVLFNKLQTTLIAYPADKSGSSYAIPNSVTSIGENAFYVCTSLTSVTIPNSVTSIGENAFEGCTLLASVTIPNSVTSIGVQAFQSCTSLTSITIGSSVTSIGAYAFYQTTFSSITIPYSVSSIGDGAFTSSSLATVTIVNGQIISNITFISPVLTQTVSFFGRTVSTSSLTPLPPPPSNTGSPTILGSTVVGFILTTTDGTWTNYPRSYTYQWYRASGSNQPIAIVGATLDTYITQQGDIGSAITCRVTATNVSGTAGPATSYPVTITLPPGPTPPPSPTPSPFVPLPNVLSITVDSNVEYMYALYIVDISGGSDNGFYIAKIDATTGTIINSNLVFLGEGVGLVGLAQILIIGTNLYLSNKNVIFIITNINTTTPGIPTLWFTSTIPETMFAGLTNDGTYIYVADVTSNVIIRQQLPSSVTPIVPITNNNSWVSLTYNPVGMTINNGYIYVTCFNDIISYISRINTTGTPVIQNEWVNTSGYYATGLAIYGSYMYVALSTDPPNPNNPNAKFSLGLIYLSNGGATGILQNPNWVPIPNSLVSLGMLLDVIITEKNQNVNLFICDDIIEIPLAGDTPISNICFPAGTPITTDQGIIAIEKINPNIHTINKKPIVDIIKTIYNDKYLIGFKKNAICKNCPSQFTVMTKNHKIIWQGRKCDAESFLYRYENVGKVKYNGEILYNVLMEEHSEMLVNNMLCETLDPNNTVAKLYKRGSKYTPGDRYKISKFIADSVKNTKFDKYKTYRNIIKNI